MSLLGAVALANVRLEFPGRSPGPPAYAEISHTPPWGLAINRTDEWAAITFYRLPSCVPATFNLFDFADVPAAFGCQLTVQGFEVWTAPPPDGKGPIQVTIWGLGAVPIYFVRWLELQAATQDRVLTIGELQGLPSLRIGYASFYTSDAHPAMTAPTPQYIGPFQISAEACCRMAGNFSFRSRPADRQVPQNTSRSHSGSWVERHRRCEEGGAVSGADPLKDATSAAKAAPAWARAASTF